MKGSPRISFLGAAENVTGSRHLLEVAGRRVLVDCGLHQERQFKDRDFKPFPVEPGSIDAVLLTHAHLDHCGYLPKLVKDGFAGPIYCTEASEEIARIVLRDSAYLQTEDARYKRKRHKRAGKVSPRGYEPLYGMEDVERAMRQFQAVPWDEAVDLGGGVEATFRTAGHIFGSAFIRVTYPHGAGPHGAGPHDGRASARRSILFSGDVGRFDKPILKDPEVFAQADYVVIESTYGDRVHDDVDIDERLAEVVQDTVARGGNLLIPTFAIERAQEVLYHLNDLILSKRIPPLLVFLDSPMAIRVSDVFAHHPERFDAEMRAHVRGGRSPFTMPQLTYTRTAEQSKGINQIRGTSVILAGSGMCTGGRIKHHLVQNLSRSESTLLFVGYQASGTLGRQLRDGSPEVRVLGQTLPVRARVESIGAFSAHADRDELTRWVGSLREAPRRVFVVHGETEAAHSFRDHLASEKGWDVVVPQYRNSFVLD